MMSPSELWAEETANPSWDNKFTCMTSWSVGMFNVAMKFASKYAEYRLGAARVAGTPTKED